MVNPLINYGQVKHSRLRPVSNRFSYGVFTLKIPMRQRNRNPTGHRKQPGMGGIYFYPRGHFNPRR